MSEQQDEFTIENLTIEQGSFGEQTLLDRESDEPAEKSAVSEKDLAFLKSGAPRTLPFGGREGGELELKPFDTIRQVAADNMGLKGFSLGEDDIETFQETETYPGLLIDAIYVCFLCASAESVAQKAWHAPRTVQRLAMQWSTKHEIMPGTVGHGAVMEVWGSIYMEILLNSSQINDSGGGADGDETGQSLGES